MRTGDQKKPKFMAEIIPQVGMVKKTAEVMGWECKLDLTRHIVLPLLGSIQCNGLM